MDGIRVYGPGKRGAAEVPVLKNSAGWAPPDFGHGVAEKQPEDIGNVIVRMEAIVSDYAALHDYVGRLAQRVARLEKPWWKRLVERFK